jgi:Helix-turn-helix domain
VARKFSLKDNPIFQRLQVPGKKADDSQPGVVGIIEDPADLPQDEGTDSREGQYLRVENKPSKFDPQNLTLNKEGEPQNEPEGQHREVIRSSDSTAAHGYIEEKQIEKVQEAPSFAPVADLSQVIQSTSDRTNEHLNEGHNLTLKNRASNYDPQIESPDEAPRKVKDIPAHKLKDEFARDRVTSGRHSSDLDEGQNLTLKNSPSETARGNSGEKEENEASLERTSAPDLGLQDNFDKSLFFSFYNEVCDQLLPTLDGAEQILYARLFRLSYGFNRNYCCVSQPVLGEKTGLSRNTVRTALQLLIEKEWVCVIEAGRHVSTKYRVYLPRERNRGSKLDPQKKGVKIRPSKTDHQNLSVRFRGSNIDKPEGQKTEVQNLTVKKPLSQFSSVNSSLPDGPPNFDPQEMPPLLLTHNSSTLS